MKIKAFNEVKPPEDETVLRLMPRTDGGSGLKLCAVDAAGNSLEGGIVAIINEAGVLTLWPSVKDKYGIRWNDQDGKTIR